MHIKLINNKPCLPAGRTPPKIVELKSIKDNYILFSMGFPIATRPMNTRSFLEMIEFLAGLERGGYRLTYPKKL